MVLRPCRAAPEKMVLASLKIRPPSLVALQLRLVVVGWPCGWNRRAQRAREDRTSCCEQSVPRQAAEQAVGKHVEVLLEVLEPRLEDLLAQRLRKLSALEVEEQLLLREFRPARGTEPCAPLAED